MAQNMIIKGKRRVATSSGELRAYLAETISRSQFTLQRIKLSEQNQWSLRDGAISHFSNGFFHVTGLKNRHSAEEHLVLYQPQSALTGLALYKDGRDVYVLLQARVEPGLLNIGEYGPTVQSTAANYLQLHGGRETSHIELFRSYSPIANPLGHTIQFDLGQRYFQKQKLHSYVELDELLDTAENMIWVPLPVIAAVLHDDNFLNPDLRSLLAVFDWDRYLHGDLTGSQNQENMAGNWLTLPPNQLGNNDWKLVALEDLMGWAITDYGVADLSASGIWVDMFHTSCFSREVREWSQPLLSCANHGLVLLLVRERDGDFEFLLSTEYEFGIGGGVVVLPSIVIYPGDNRERSSTLFANETVLAMMRQSEEGGRFYDNESIYQVILARDTVTVEPHQSWVKAETLKALLKSSSRASLQLRCIASLVLDLLNPITMGQTGQL